MIYRTALVTGASSGLGRGLALWLAKRGVVVYAGARRTDRLEALAREGGGSITPLTMDVADADATHARITALDREVGGLDLVIANAGLGDRRRGQQAEWSATRRLLEVNVVGAVATLSAALPAMVARGRGHLVGISSLASLVALPGSATYCASKAFLNMWLEGVRLEVQSRGVDVTCIQPGFVKTELTQDFEPSSMPFLLEAADAVERMGLAIERKDQVVAFPWPLATLVRAVAALPRSVRSLALRRAEARRHRS